MWIYTSTPPYAFMCLIKLSTGTTLLYFFYFTFRSERLDEKHAGATWNYLSICLQTDGNNIYTLAEMAGHRTLRTRFHFLSAVRKKKQSMRLYKSMRQSFIDNLNYIESKSRMENSNLNHTSKTQYVLKRARKRDREIANLTKCVLICFLQQRTETSRGTSI
jgi:hypothetical protein